MLARNGDLNGIITSVKQMEDRFNKKFKYPYVFLNEEPFSDDFKKLVILPLAALTHHSITPPQAGDGAHRLPRGVRSYPKG